MNEALRRLLAKMKLVPDKEYLESIESGTPLVCPRASELDGAQFPDNMMGECSVCKMPIVFRPYNRTATLKICIQCCMQMKGEN